MRDEEQTWMMFVVGSLAGGASAKQAVENADKVREAAKSRFGREKDDNED